MLTIRTERLILRPYVPGDAAALAAHRSDPEVARYCPWTPPYLEKTAADLIGRAQWRGRGAGFAHIGAGEGALIAVERVEGTGQGGTLVGDVAFVMHPVPHGGSDVESGRQASIGFTLARPHWGKGYATEAVRALLGELFGGTGETGGVGLHRVTAECGADNPASVRVLERVGMRREAHFVQNIFFKGAWASEYAYAMLRSEWRG